MVLLSLILWRPLLAAEEDMWGVCRHVPPPPPAPSPISSEEAPIHITADRGETLDQVHLLKGNITLTRGDQQLQAAEARYDATTQDVQASGNVRFQEENVILSGKEAHINLETRRSELYQAEYYLLERHGRGEASSIVRTGRRRTILNDATYTTCDPGDNDWYLSSHQVKLNHESGTGSATHVFLSAQGVPFFYLPYISFPINNERKTGMLTPKFGHSSETGTDLQVPVYINLAPNYDATLSPRYIETRGLQTQAEFRYLTRSSRGLLNIEYLPDDNLFSDDRSRIAYQHRSTLSPRWQTALELNHVSDVHYFEDLGSSLSTASITHTEQRADLTYRGTYSALLVRVQGYKTVDQSIPESEKPYQRLPQIVYTADAPVHPLDGNYHLSSELVQFDHEVNVSGSRLDLQPSMTLPFESQSYFFNPKVKLWYTQYQLTNQIPALPTELERTLPIVSVDAGIFLDRTIKLGGRETLHTLEPRLFYLNIPYKNQDTFPVFDTGAPDFTYAQLFAENRYTGVDRVGDTRQLSASLSTRLIGKDTGNEWLRASIGQIYYAHDRKVALNSTLPETRPSSDVVGELSSRFKRHWLASADLQWNPEIDKVEKGGIQFQYKSAPRQIFNIGYRFRREQVEQTDVSFLWPLLKHWHVVGRWNYSHLDDRPLETLGGVEYESCCWAVRLYSRTYINTVTNDVAGYNHAVFLQVELKGLTSLGSPIEQVLEHGILGYH